jgi:hypothetical protein
LTEPRFDLTLLLMTAKAKATINQFEADQFALRDKVAARLQSLSAAETARILVSVGVLTKQGKLAAGYRPNRVAS